MYARLLKKPLELNQSFFLFGPRGVGKTTWLKQTFSSDNCIYLDLLEPALYQSLLAMPARLENYITSTNKWIILDEIQRIPALLNEVHRLIESKQIKFILTGSSARSLRKKGVNLLAGRALIFHLYPLTATELKENFKLASSLLFGHLPSVFQVVDPKFFLQSYVQAYLKEEVLQEGLTRNIGNFSRFLEIASLSQGSVINFSEIAREAMIERKVVTGYFQILEDLLLAIRLPIFTKRTKRRMIMHHKFYFFDVGVFRSIRPQGLLDSNEEIEGPALETLCLQEILAINDYFDLNYQIYFWHTATGLEVDFILYGPKGFFAIEVKRTKNIHPKDLKGLNAFAKDFPEAKLILLYGGDHELQIENINIIPVEKALIDLKEILYP